MSAEEIKTQIDQIGQSWEEYKKANDGRLEQLEKSQGQAAEETAKLERIEGDLKAALDLKKQLEDTQAAVKRISALDAQEKKEQGSEELKAYASGLKKLAMANYKEHAVQYTDAEKKAMSSNIDPQGGYSVQPFFGSTESIIFDTSPVRNLATVTNIGTNEYIGYYDDDELGAGWVGETASRPTTATPEIGQLRIPVNEMYCNPAITENLLEDSSFNLPAWIREKAVDKFGRLEATAFVSGDGVSKPRGLISYTAKTTNPGVYARDQVGALTTAGATAITTDEMIQLRQYLKPAYRGNAYFAYNRNTEGYIRRLKDGQGNYIWQPSYQMGEADMLLGQRTVIFEDMPDIATGAIAVMIADFRKTYQIVDRVGLSILEDPYSAKPYRTFYMRRRVGGGIKNFDSIKYLVQA